MRHACVVCVFGWKRGAFPNGKFGERTIGAHVRGKRAYRLKRILSFER
uniref:Uncharacterized protein n=1 Tax=Anguilla anguilla TaxID=7936 RepID=A0A0E9WKA4_ANGAN